MGIQYGNVFLKVTPNTLILNKRKTCYNNIGHKTVTKYVLIIKKIGYTN